MQHHFPRAVHALLFFALLLASRVASVVMPPLPPPVCGVLKGKISVTAPTAYANPLYLQELGPAGFELGFHTFNAAATTLADASLFEFDTCHWLIVFGMC